MPGQQNILLKIILIVLVFGQITAHAGSSAQSGSSTCPAPTAAAPVWGKLVISGNEVTCYYAQGTATPKTWTQIGSSVTINFVNDPILVGIYIASHDDTAVATGTIDNFSISPTPTYRLADYDIGAPELMGSANFIGNSWMLSGSGADLWGTSDQCNYQSWLVEGDCTITCRVTSLTASGNMWEKIGIMVRDGFNSGSDYALFCASNGSGVAFQYRSSFTNNPDTTEFVAPSTTEATSGVAVGMGLTGNTSYTLRP